MQDFCRSTTPLLSKKSLLPGATAVYLWCRAFFFPFAILYLLTTVDIHIHIGAIDARSSTAIA